MSIVVNIYYSGENGSARKFAKEMISSGTVDAIRNEAGNIRYDYFFPLGDEETVLLIDSWENQESIDFHHQSPMMNKIAELNLIRNGYLQGKHIDGSIFDEYIHILNTMSYREIQYLVEYKKYCEDSSKRGKSTKHINGRTYSNKYESFCNEYSKQIKVSPGEVDYVFLHIKQTGFIEEEFETESGDVDENDNTFDSLDVESKGYYITKEFLDFYEMVLKRNENNG